jgi:hypothetical protein
MAQSHLANLAFRQTLQKRQNCVCHQTKLPSSNSSSRNDFLWVDRMLSGQNVMLTKCWVDEMSSWQNVELMKCQADKMSN